MHITYIDHVNAFKNSDFIASIVAQDALWMLQKMANQVLKKI